MKLTALGTGTVAPSARRAAPAWWLEAGAVRLLMDVGAGTLLRAAAHEVRWPAVTHIALTHFHVDHWGELPHILFALKHGTEPARSAPLDLLGPAGLATRMAALAEGFGPWVTGEDLGYDLRIREIAPDASVALAEDVTLETCATPHTDESLALAVRHGGARVVYTGDTGPSDRLAAWARGCDLLIAECSLPAERAIPLHLTPERAGALARAAGARRLVLTHFYPPVEAVEPARLAAAVFDGDVVAAADGDVFTIEA